MNLSYSNKIYSDWVEESKKVFSKWSDSDFYSDKAEHIYFYSVVHDESVSQLQKLLQQSSKTKNNGVISPPKPVVIHLNSPGGSVLSQNLFNVMMTTQRVPLCVVIESECASAATTLGLLAPYRVMIDFSFYLIHDSFSGSYGKDHEKITSNFTYIYQQHTNYLALLKDRTKLSDSEIKTYIARDMLLSTSYCLKKKIIDRIIKFPKIKNSSNYNKSIYTNLSLNLSTFLKKTNLNHLYIDTRKLYSFENIGGLDTATTLQDCSSLSEICMSLDKFILSTTDVRKPLLIHFKPSVEFYLFTNCSPIELISLQYRLALIQKKMPVIALIEGPQALDTLSLILMCPIRIMMTPSIISSYFSIKYTGSMGYGMKTIDVLYNTTYTLKEVIRFFKTFSKLPSKFYTDFTNKIINLKPEELLQYEVIHQLVNFRKTTPITLKNIEEYYDLKNITNKKK